MYTLHKDYCNHSAVMHPNVGDHHRVAYPEIFKGRLANQSSIYMLERYYTLQAEVARCMVRRELLLTLKYVSSGTYHSSDSDIKYSINRLKDKVRSISEYCTNCYANSIVQISDGEYMSCVSTYLSCFVIRDFLIGIGVSIPDFPKTFKSGFIRLVHLYKSSVEKRENV